ncbi:hypothetical protein [Novipirellula caenicola]|uniref:Uncharacterized protein n=1 Tax=Novipirellula caenicola TaxID=1536901 RepID=A0ABP9VS85_9BACT
MRTTLCILAVLSLCSLSGCTARRLRIQSVQHAQTLSDIFQQQTLDNLAKFARDPNALPDFAIPTSGLSQVADTGEINGSLGWASRVFDSASLGGKGTRKTQADWTLKPISDPRKLERMRCLLQRAIAACGSSCRQGCPDCEKSLSKFFYGDSHYAGSSSTSSEVDLSCLHSGWFVVSCEKCAREKYDKCCLIGEHCGTVVCVPRGEGSNQLSLLTIALLDIAQNDPPTVAKKRVKAYLTDKGKLTTEANASFEVERELPVNVSAVGVLSPTERKLNQSLLEIYEDLGIKPSFGNSGNIEFSTDTLKDEKKEELQEKLQNLPSVFEDPQLNDTSYDMIESMPSEPFVPIDQIFQRQVDRFRD